MTVVFALGTNALMAGAGVAAGVDAPAATAAGAKINGGMVGCGVKDEALPALEPTLDETTDLVATLELEFAERGLGVGVAAPVCVAPEGSADVCPVLDCEVLDAAEPPEPPPLPASVVAVLASAAAALPLVAALELVVLLLLSARA